MRFYLDLGMLLPKLSIFTFQGFLKLSEGEETIKCWWAQKLEYVKGRKCSYKPRTLFFPKSICAIYIYIYTHIYIYIYMICLDWNVNQHWHCTSNIAHLDINYFTLSYIYIYCTATIYIAVSAVLHQWHDEHISSTLLQLEFSSLVFFSFWSTQLKSSNGTSQIPQLGENSLWKTSAKLTE